MTSVSFTNQLLIAMPNLADPHFSQTVTLICEHNENGSLGVVINRPSELQLDELLEHMDIDYIDRQDLLTPVYEGGPVATGHGFILHQPLGNWETTLRINSQLGLTTSRDILIAIAEERGPASSPEQCLVALGYAGWGPGQLETEMAENAWLTVASDPEIIFDLDCEQRWRAAANKLGIDLNLLTGSAGHA